MELLPYMKYILGLLVVLGLIGLITVAARKFGMIPRAENRKTDKKRLGVTQVISVDAKRRLVLVRRDDREHLLLLGPERDLVIEQNIPLKKAPPVSEPVQSSNDHDADHEPKLPVHPRKEARE